MTAKREFFTTNEIAQILGLSPFTVRRYIQTRKLKAVKLEGSYRVRRSHLDDFIQAREIETAEELEELEQAEEEMDKPRPGSPAAAKIEKKKLAHAPFQPAKGKSSEEKIEKKKLTRASKRPSKRKSPARSSNRRKEEA